MWLDKFAEKHYMEFSIRAPYEWDVTPYVERKEYTIDRKEIEEHRDEMSYRGENGFYRFIRTDALFDDETDVVVRDLINCRFCDWEDIYEGEKYKWMWW